MVVITKKSVLIKANKLKHWPTAYQKKNYQKMKVRNNLPF